MEKRVLASLLTLVMVFSLLPFSALADEEPESSMEQAGVQDSAELTVDESGADEQIVQEPTAEERLAELIADLPDPADIDPQDEAQAEEISGQISEIYAFAEENSLNDVYDNETVNAVIAALYPVETLADSGYIGDGADQRTLRGSGTESDPYLISKAGDLDKIRYYLVNTDEENKPDTINSQVIDGYFKLTRNIDMASFGKWTPIGMTEGNKDIRYKTAFVGTLDGGGYTISNLTLSTAYRGIGLFTRIGEGGSVKDLTIDTCKADGEPLTAKEFGAICGTAWGGSFSNISLKNIKLSGGMYAGALTGDTWTSGGIGTTVKKCIVEDSSISGGAATGGLIGRTHIDDTVIECTVSKTSVSATGHSVGGLVGIAAGMISDCHTMDIAVKSTSTDASAFAGGLIGQSTAISVENCSSTGVVNAGLHNVGGGLIAYIASETPKKVRNCHAHVKVTAAQYAGGLIGQTSGASDLRISYCHATGAVTVNGNSNDNDHMGGGLIARAGGVIVENCYATGTVSSAATALKEGMNDNNKALGGLIGKATGACEISNSYSTGNVISVVDAGGLIGKNNADDTIRNCYATGDVTLNTHKSSTKTYEAGGFIGSAYGTIENCYATGAVSGSGVVGGFAGSVPSTVKIETAAASGTVSSTDGTAGGFVGSASIGSRIKSALAVNRVSGNTAGAFAGSVATIRDGLDSCYANSTSSIPFTGTYSGYYSPQNCFYAGNVTGILAGRQPNGSSDQTPDYYYARMDFSDITGTYDDTLAIAQTDTIGASANGKTPKHGLTVKASPESLVSVGDDGSMTAGTPGNGTLSLVMEVNGKDFVFGSASVTVTAKSISVTMTAKTETYNGNTKTIEAAADNGETLPKDLELVYSYRESTADDNTYTHIPPAAPGTYTVKVESGNPNYTLTGATTATLTISKPQADKDVSEEVVVANPSLVYDGAAKTYAAAHEGITSWVYAYYSEDGTKLGAAPVNAGSYNVTITGSGEGIYAVRTISFRITPATITIRPKDKTAYVGGAKPVLGVNDYTVTGLVAGENLKKPPTLSYAADPNMNAAGTYDIIASDANAGDNYAISYVNGTLTVRTRSGGGSGSGGSTPGSTAAQTVTNEDGSKTTIVTDKKTGAVTETTRYKDGSTLSVETKKDGTVTTAEDRADGVRVRTVDEPGKDITASVTIPKGVGTATVTVPADVTPGTVAVDAETGKIVKLSVPTGDGMLVKLEGSVDLVLEDRSKKFTDTVGHWAEDAVDFVTAHGMFNGTGETTFAPDRSMTRGMIAVVLYNFEDRPEYAFEGGFEDVAADSWYADGILWMVDSGIAGGYGNGSFGAEDVISREQLAAFLYRYADAMGYDTSGGAGLDRFSDAESVSGYAREAMSWAVGAGIINGRGDGALDPRGSATRAQVAAMLTRLCTNLTK